MDYKKNKWLPPIHPPIQSPNKKQSFLKRRITNTKLRPQFSFTSTIIQKKINLTRWECRSSSLRGIKHPTEGDFKDFTFWNYVYVKIGAYHKLSILFKRSEIRGLTFIKIIDVPHLVIVIIIIIIITKLNFFS